MSTDALLAAELGGDVPEIDLHGRRRDEAAAALEAFVQSAFMRGEPAIRVICGRGSGTLFEAMREFLEAHRLVETVRMPHDPGRAGAVLYASIIKK